MSLSSEDRDWIANVLESKLELFKLKLLLEYYNQRDKPASSRNLIDRVHKLEERVATLEHRLGPEPTTESPQSAFSA